MLPSSILDFSLAKYREWSQLSRVQTKYRDATRGWKDIESNFYSNDSLIDDLESEFDKAF